MKRSIRHLALAVLVLGLMSTHARADITLDFTTSSLTGTIDFTITSSDNSTLSSVGLELVLSQSPGPNEIAEFTSPQTTTPFANPNPSGPAYVFAGQSLGADFGLPFWFSPTTGASNNDTITGGDSDDGSGLGYVTLSSTPAYLATVQYQVDATQPTVQTYQLTLVNNPGTTYFDDLNNNPLNYTASISGNVVNIDVTSNSVSAVPEPSSVGMVALCGVVGFVVHRRSRRQRQHLTSTDISAG